MRFTDTIADMPKREADADEEVTPFDGFDPKALAFFRQLARNNDRDWFKANKDRYDALLKTPMLTLLNELNPRFARFAPDHVTEPKKAIYRIYRDTRFSKNKIPFKLNISAMYGHRLLPKNYCAGYYFHVSATECAIGVGVYMPEPDQLKAIREAIARDTKSFEKLIRDPKLTRRMGKLQGDKLTRVPKGYDPAHPAANYVRMKQWYFYKELKPQAALAPSFVDEVAKAFEVCAPFAAWLNAIILTTVRQDDAPDAPKRPAPMF
jgi:uncharacterized protein (TIGR02453 family)